MYLIVGLVTPGNGRHIRPGTIIGPHNRRSCHCSFVFRYRRIVHPPEDSIDSVQWTFTGRWKILMLYLSPGSSDNGLSPLGWVKENGFTQMKSEGGPVDPICPVKTVSLSGRTPPECTSQTRCRRALLERKDIGVPEWMSIVYIVLFRKWIQRLPSFEMHVQYD